MRPPIHHVMHLHVDSLAWLAREHTPKVIMVERLSGRDPLRRVECQQSFQQVDGMRRKTIHNRPRQYPYPVVSPRCLHSYFLNRSRSGYTNLSSGSNTSAFGSLWKSGHVSCVGTPHMPKISFNCKSHTQSVPPDDAHPYTASMPARTWSISVLPCRMGLPSSISAKMQPTDHVSTE